MTAVKDLVAGLCAGDAAALARAIGMVENRGPAAAQILGAIQDRLGRARVVGFTGAPGAGKSTLVSAYVDTLRRRGQTVGVVAVDPSSPFTGGAILGDRIRMTRHSEDPGVFVRSLAARGHLGGLSAAALWVVDLMDAAGKDVVLLETVGTGQSETEIAQVAATKVVVLAPGLGDDVQAIKAGILEIADIFVVNKGDRPLARQSAAQLKASIGLRRKADWKPPVLVTSAIDGQGLEELADAIAAHGDWLARPGQPGAEPAAAGRDALGRLHQLLADAAGRIAAEDVRSRDAADLRALLEALKRGEVDLETAARRALDLRLPAQERIYGTRGPET